MPSTHQAIYQVSQVAVSYSRCRPTYPVELFEYLASLLPQRLFALDCGTGNGQAAKSLGSIGFARVLAIDASQEQLNQTDPRVNVEYQRWEAETLPVPDRSVDLVTAAQAVHWFDLKKFYPEVKRVLRPGGVLAVWCYLLPSVSEEIDRVLGELFRDERLCAYWPGWIEHIKSGYTTLPCLPGTKWSPFEFDATADRDLNAVCEFVETWAATRLALKAGDSAAVACLDEGRKNLAEVWGSATRERTLTWRIRGVTVRLP